MSVKFRLIIITLLLISISLFSSQFAKYDKIEKVSKSFVRNLDFKEKNLEKVKFFLESRNFYSAFLSLTRVISKNREIREIFNYAESIKYEFSFRHVKLTEINPGFVQKEIKGGNSDLFRIYISVLKRMIHGYEHNKLTGPGSWDMWNSMDFVYKKSLQKGHSSELKAGVYGLRSLFDFFRDKKKSKRRFRRYLKKSEKFPLKDKVIKYIIKIYRSS